MEMNEDVIMTITEECCLIAPKGYHFVGRSVGDTDHSMHFTRGLGAGYETKSHWYARVYRELANTEIRLCNANECAYCENRWCY